MFKESSAFSPFPPLPPPPPLKKQISKHAMHFELCTLIWSACDVSAALVLCCSAGGKSQKRRSEWCFVQSFTQSGFIYFLNSLTDYDGSGSRHALLPHSGSSSLNAFSSGNLGGYSCKGDDWNILYLLMLKAHKLLLYFPYYFLQWYDIFSDQKVLISKQKIKHTHFVFVLKKKHFFANFTFPVSA